jgi:hypothetical protein
VPDYTRCRTLGHAWFDVDSDWKTDLGGTPLTVRCERCMCERRDTISRTTGDLVARNYYYPEQYKMTALETPSRADFRLMLISLRLKEARQARNGAKAAAS